MSLTKRKIAKHVAEILDIGYDGSKTTAGVVVNTVLAAMTKALQRGEHVEIVGLGTFFLRDVPARRRYFSFPAKYFTFIPKRKVVGFRPNSDLKKELNASPA